ncbi:MAG: dockerin type I repeat-containing protein [Prevotella sp.]|nr:dockerin type I repeat-containing protein [Prevotella sp.]
MSPLTNASFVDGTLTINFMEAAGIEAGRPYLVKWNNDTEHPTLGNPVFVDVTINNASPKDKAVTTNVLTFQGQYAPLAIGENGDNTLLYLGTDNSLHYPESATTINAFRAWLKANANIGDIDGNGMVTVTDVTCLVNIVLGSAMEGLIIGNADITGDGMVSVTDVTALVNLILNGSSIINVVVNGADGLTANLSQKPFSQPLSEGRGE